jgi:hypothetical protein
MHRGCPLNGDACRRRVKKTYQINQENVNRKIAQTNKICQDLIWIKKSVTIANGHVQEPAGMHGGGRELAMQVSSLQDEAMHRRVAEPGDHSLLQDIGKETKMAWY